MSIYFQAIYVYVMQGRKKIELTSPFSLFAIFDILIAALTTSYNRFICLYNSLHILLDHLIDQLMVQFPSFNISHPV